MALRNILTEENEVLRKQSKTVKNFDEKLWELLDDMQETMYQNDGCGIAAPQVGVLKRVVIVDACNMRMELINPEIIAQSGEQTTEEGCLSVANHTGLVTRPYEVTVKAQDRYGNKFTISVENVMSTVFCHELDHLDGILFIDKAEKLYKKIIRKKKAK